MQFAGWLCRFAAFWCLLEAFNVGGSVEQRAARARRQRDRRAGAVHARRRGRAAGAAGEGLRLRRDRRGVLGRPADRDRGADLRASASASVVWIFRFSSFKEVIARGPRAARGGEGRGSGRRDPAAPPSSRIDGAALLAFLALRAVPGVEECRRPYRRAAAPHGAASRRCAGRGGMRVELRPRRSRATRTRRLAQLPELLDLDAPVGGDRGRASARPAASFTPGTRVPGCVERRRDRRPGRARRSRSRCARRARTRAGSSRRRASRCARPRGTITHLFPTLEAIAARARQRVRDAGARAARRCARSPARRSTA